MTAPAPFRLLVVDDEPLLLRSLCETLRDEGHETSGSTRGRAALDILRAGGVDLLLADLAMPEMDGIALLREALRIDPGLVVIIMTGEGTIGSAVEAMRSGASDYILKPFKLGALRLALERGLSMRALRRENLALEGRLRERAAELEAANRELEAFTRSASHDLRAPLARISGLAQLLGARFGRELPHEAAQWIGLIEEESLRMTALLDDLMRLSRLGRQTLRLETVDVALLVQEIAAEYAGRESVRMLDFRVGLLPPAWADRALLRQVFVNLLGNAVKFTRGRSLAVIEVGAEVAGSVEAYFVKDNGAGFDMAGAAAIFSPFQRFHRADDYEGNGVGLSLVERIVSRHGGRIWAEAAVDHGATFRFTLAAACG